LRDLSGEQIEERAEIYNKLFLNAFETLLTGYEGLYPSMGNAQVMTAKIVWDFLLYWAFIANLFFQGKQCDLEFMASVATEVSKANHLNARVQTLFRDWDLLDQSEFGAAFVDLLEIDFLRDQHFWLEAQLDEEGLRERLRENLKLLESVAAEIFRKAAAGMARVSESKTINPYGIGLNPDYWDADDLFADGPNASRDPAVVGAVAKMWLEPVASVQTGADDQQELDRSFAAG
ncbi:MAG TPA: hypothetical protein VLZ81_11325, partial [Blastocatellia bacterium]|nr:hypothetical protein [Blastocatellia bacterium]